MIRCILVVGSWLAAVLPGVGGAADGGQELAEVRQRLKKVAEAEYELDGIRIHAGSHEVRIPARVELRDAAIEYLLVHETGKTHESVLTTAVSPMAVQLALLLADYQPATEGLLDKVPPAERSPEWKVVSPARPRGHCVRLTVEWKTEEGVKRAPLADWVQNIVTRKSPADLKHWIFNGSYVDESGFVASQDGSIVAMWLDRGAILNAVAEESWLDDVWRSLPAHIPEEGTPVTLVISPYTP